MQLTFERIGMKSGFHAIRITPRRRGPFFSGGSAATPALLSQTMFQIGYNLFLGCKEPHPMVDPARPAVVDGIVKSE